jgi:hypothetical protein
MHCARLPAAIAIVFHGGCGWLAPPTPPLPRGSNRADKRDGRSRSCRPRTHADAPSHPSAQRPCAATPKADRGVRRRLQAPVLKRNTRATSSPVQMWHGASPIPAQMGAGGRLRSGIRAAGIWPWRRDWSTRRHFHARVTRESQRTCVLNTRRQVNSWSRCGMRAAHRRHESGVRASEAWAGGVGAYSAVCARREARPRCCARRIHRGDWPGD